MAQDYQLNPDMVIHCFKEVVTAFKNLLYEEKNCELPFPKIGKLQIKNKIVTMKFYREFLDRYNQTLKNRLKDQNKTVDYDPNWDAYQYKRQVSPLYNVVTLLFKNICIVYLKYSHKSAPIKYFAIKPPV